MAEIELYSEIDLADVLAGLDAMQKAGKDLRPLWKQVRPLLKTDLGQHFADRAGPNGAWPAWAASPI